MLAFVCSYLLFLLLTLRKTRAWLFKWSLMGGVLALLAMSDFGVRILRPVLTGRFMVYTLQQKNYGERDTYAAAAWQLFLQSPILGMGVDGFKELSGTGAAYTHNLILAVASEGGSIGLFFLLLSGIFLFNGRRKPKSLEHLTALSLAVFYFGASQFSGGYYDCRWLWVLGAMYLLPCTTNRGVRLPLVRRSPLRSGRPDLPERAIRIAAL
jgi:O-antigen ligase